MFRWLLVLLVIVALGAGAAWVVAGRSAAPRLTIDQPARVVGQRGTLAVTAQAPGARFETLTVAVEQNGRRTPLFSLQDGQTATVAQRGPDAIHITRPLGKRSLPALRSGPARIVVSASRRSWLNLRTISAETSRDITVQLEPPQLAIVSSHHYVNHGGSEMVVYRVAPPGVESGVRVGSIEYPGYPASGAGVAGAEPGLTVAFFALLPDQDLDTPIVAFARDEAGNEARASFVDNVFEKPFKRSRIQIDDAFMRRVVPEIIDHSPDLKIAPPAEGGDLLEDFLVINGKLRQLNADQIRRTALSHASATRQWHGPFVQLGNSQVEAAFADHRTYVYQGREIDQQVHLGFDLAVTAHVPVLAANDGIVLNASWLGIYGNCLIIDHGMGVASLYGHLMSFDVKVGDHVRRGQQIGRTDTTGLAGGDHLHFTMLVGGQMVNPVEWWDPHWIQDRVERKIEEAGGPSSTAAAGPARGAAAAANRGA